MFVLIMLIRRLFFLGIMIVSSAINFRIVMGVVVVIIIKIVIYFPAGS